MDTKKEDIDVRTAPEAPAMPHLVNLDLDLALYLWCPYMGQWTWLMTRWRDFSRPSGPSQLRGWTPTLSRERGRERRMQEKAWQTKE